MGMRLVEWEWDWGNGNETGGMGMRLVEWEWDWWNGNETGGMEMRLGEREWDWWNEGEWEWDWWNENETGGMGMTLVEWEWDWWNGNETHTMIKGHWIDDHEVLQIVFVRVIVAMPTNYIKGGVVLYKNTHQRVNNPLDHTHLTSSKQGPLELSHDSVPIRGEVPVLIPGHRG